MLQRPKVQFLLRLSFCPGLLQSNYNNYCSFSKRPSLDLIYMHFLSMECSVQFNQIFHDNDIVIVNFPL